MDKVLLVSPGIIKWRDLDFGLPHMVSLGGYLAEHTGVGVEIIDLGYEGGDHRHLERVLADLGPFRLIGVACYSSYDFMRVTALARFLRRLYPDVPLVAGGYHASAQPRDLVDAGFDAVVVGEGERPLRGLVERVLGGGRLDGDIVGPQIIDDLDTLPPMRWELLDRYWPRATQLGRKLQLYLSRGCPFHCTFCMERAKGERAWRAYSAERAIDELRRLASRADLAQWVVNLADPLFGFRRAWRRQVLEAICSDSLLPRMFWTLTRAEDLEAEDVELLARARFSIGVGLESGSPDMLLRMQKTRQPGPYLGGFLRLAALAQEHGLNWSVNLVAGHPGETLATLAETRAFAGELFGLAEPTRGWLSVDPFRLYPGSAVHGQRERWEAETGAVFHHPEWWRSWYDTSFRSEHIEPSAELSYAERVRFIHDAYPPLMRSIRERFEGQGRDVDRVFQHSLDEQDRVLSDERRDLLLAKAARPAGPRGEHNPSLPMGLAVRDAWVRRREAAVRRLLDAGVLGRDDVIEALLEEPPERWMPAEHAEAMLLDRPLAPAVEGLPPLALGIRTIALGLEALQVREGEACADLVPATGYVGALLARLSGRETLAADLYVKGEHDVLWIGAALPRFPLHLLERLGEGGRVLAVLGPRFRPQDLVIVDASGETTLGRVRVPVLGGPFGWVPEPPRPDAPADVLFEAHPTPALSYRVLAHLDLGRDAANQHDPALPGRPWVADLLAAYEADPRRLWVHVAGLRAEPLSRLLARIRSEPGTLLARRFADALEAEEPHLRYEAEVPAAVSALAQDLSDLRRKMWAQTLPAPPLRVFHAPALGPRGRATAVGGERRVATSLSEDPRHVFLQVLHEEMHAITDPIVRAGRTGRDTRVGSPGWALHVELEETAIAATHAILEAHASRWLPAFEEWHARQGSGLLR